LPDLLINQPSTQVTGTHSQGTIRASGPELIRKLGQPQQGDGYKTFFEWTIESENGIATIYDWKLYASVEEAVVHLVYHESPITWNIGGHNGDCWRVLDDAGIEENQNSD